MEVETETVDVAPSEGLETVAAAPETPQTAPEVVETAEVETPEPADMPESVVAAPEKTESVVEAPVEPWVGEISKLNDLGWYKELPPQQRKSLSEGLATVRKNMDRAFHAKSAEISAQRKALEDRERLILAIAKGDVDADQTIDEAVEAKLADRLATLTAELTELKANRADPAEIAEVKAAKEALQATLDEIQANYQAASTELEAYRDTFHKVQKARAEEETNKVLDYIEKNAPDLMGNEVAFNRFLASEDFVEGDFDLALKYARLKYPAPKVAAPVKPKEAKPAEKVPDALDMMGKGSPLSDASAGGHTVHKRYNPIDDIDAEIRRERIARGG